MSSRNTKWLLVGIILILAALQFGGVTMINSWLMNRNTHVDAQALAPTPPPKKKKVVISGKPTHIAIKSVAIDLEVIPGNYYPESQEWTLSLDKAQWGTMTSEANDESGLTYIYAHYRLHVFYTLPKIQPGDEAVITTENGHTFTYKFKSSTITDPTDTSLFDYSGKPILVLQTCSGVWYENRQLFVFDFVSAE